MSRILGLLALVLAFLGAGSAQAQIAVYKLKFDPAGESINYRPYEAGYYMAPIGGGTGSLILLRTTSGQKQYFTYSNFGELFVAVKGSTRKAVITATATNDVSTTTFYAIGEAKDKMKVETRSAEANVYTASTLLKEIEYSLSSGCEFYYPGYATHEPSHYDYKKQFDGLEFLNWNTGEWQPLE